MKKYKITVNENQLRTLYSALEVLSRLHSGQWTYVFDHIFRHIFYKKHPYANYYKKMDERFDINKYIKEDDHRGTFYSVLNVLKKHLLGLSANESWGVQQKQASNDMNTAFDIQQVVRTKLGDHREPHRFDVENELPTIEEIEG